MSALGNRNFGDLLPCWQRMSVDRYAAFEQATGVNVVRIGEVWWTNTRPFFYRPLLPFEKYNQSKVRKQFDRTGIFQHAVEVGQVANSYLNPILFEKLQDYDVRKLRDNVRGSLKKALRNPITARRVTDEEEFSKIAYPIYLSFYRRTKYGFDSGRRNKTKFIQWAHQLFRFHEAVVLGAFLGEEMLAFEITCLVETTLILKTIVTSDKALSFNTPDLLLHSYREAAQIQPGIHRIYDGMLSAMPGVNKYKIMRGATVLALPAFINTHPSLLWMFKRLNEQAHQRLTGFDNDQLTVKHPIWGPKTELAPLR